MRSEVEKILVEKILVKKILVIRDEQRSGRAGQCYQAIVSRVKGETLRGSSGSTDVGSSNQEIQTFG